MVPEVSSEERPISQLFDDQRDSVKTATKLLSADPNRIMGSLLRRVKASISPVYDQCPKVWQTGEALEFTNYSPGFDKYFDVQRQGWQRHFVYHPGQNRPEHFQGSQI